MMDIDPRKYGIRRNLSSVNNILIILSSKGGVGKTFISTSLALALRELNYSSALLDLDFTNPGCHLFLNYRPKGLDITEEKGIVPPEIFGIKFLSIISFIGERPLPLRGTDITNLFIELLAIARWGGAEYLIIDTPPGIRDEILNILTYIDNPKIILVTTPSILSITSSRMIIELLRGKYRILGIIGNMLVENGERLIKNLSTDMNIKYLGGIKHYSQLDNYLYNGEFPKVFDKYIKNDVMDIVREIVTSL